MGYISRLTQKISKKVIFQSPIIQRLLGGAAWTLAGNLISRVASVCAFILLARFLGKEQLGELGVVQTTLTTLQTLGGLGLGWAVTRYIAKYKVTNVEQVGHCIYFARVAVLSCSLILAVILVCASEKISLDLYKAPHLVSLLKIGAAQVILNALVSLKTGVLMGVGAFRPLAKFNLLSGIWTFLLPVLAGWQYGIIGAVSGLAIAQALDYVLIHMIESRVLRATGVTVHSKGAWKSEIQMFWNFGLPAMIGGFLLQASLWAASVMLVNQPDGYSEMGYYNAANQWFSALMFLPAILAQSSVPLIMECLALKKFGEVQNIFKKSLLVNACFVCGFVIVGSAVSPWLMNLYGPSFVNKWPTLVLLLLAAGAAAIQLPAAQMISTSGRMWFAQTIQAAFSATLLLTSTILVKWGSEGMALARLLAYVAYALVAFAIARSMIKKLGRL